jgi:hypothetical protein
MAQTVMSAPFLVCESIEFLNHSGFGRSELVKETSGTVTDFSIEVGMLEITVDDALPIARCDYQPPTIRLNDLFILCADTD